MHQMLSCSHDEEVSVTAWEKIAVIMTATAKLCLKVQKEGVLETYSQVLCLFCKTGKEISVMDHIAREGWGAAIFPQKTRRVRDKDRWTEDSVPLMPGYLFVYMTSEQTACQFEIARIPEVIRVLGYGEASNQFLTGSDLAFACWIWQQKGRIETIGVVDEGNRVEITDSTFKKMNGTIRKMDRRRQTMLVELDKSGIVRNLWLPYSMDEKRR